MSKSTSNAGMKNAFKAGVWYTISTLLVKSIAIISTPIYTRMMSTNDYGIASTFNTWYALLSIICSLNVGYSIGRAKIDFESRFDEYIGAMQVLCAVVTIGIFLPIFMFIKPVVKFAGMSEHAIFWLFIYLFFGTIVSINQGKYRFRYEYKQNIAISIVVTVGTVVLSIPLIYLLSEKYMGKIIGTTMPMVFLGILFLLLSLKEKTISFKKEYYQYALLFSLPLIVHSLSIYVLGQSDRLMIKSFCGDSAVGIYSLIYQYALLITMVTFSINSAWNPWFHDNYALGNHALIKEKVKPLIMIGCYLGIGCVAIAPEAVLILGGENYLVGLGAVVPIALGVIIEFVYTQYVIIEMHLKKTKYISIGTVIAASINLILNYVCIPKYGYQAAAYTTLFSYIVLWGIHVFITRKIMKIHIYNDRVICSFVAATVVICGVFAALYDHIIIRYLLIVAISVVYALMNKNFILSKISGLKKQRTNL